MINEKYKALSKQRLQEYESDKVVIDPPCYNDEIYDIYEIYDSYRHIGCYINHEELMEKLHKNFPLISEEDLNLLINYFKEVDDYCINVCCAFAGIYQTVPIPTSIEGQRDKERVIKICLTRFPWIKQKKYSGYAFRSMLA